MQITRKVLFISRNINENRINTIGIRMYYDLLRLMYIARCFIFLYSRFSFVFSFFRPFDPLSFSFFRSPSSTGVLLKTFVRRFYAHRTARKWTSSAIQMILKIGKRCEVPMSVHDTILDLAIDVHKALCRASTWIHLKKKICCPYF